MKRKRSDSCDSESDNKCNDCGTSGDSSDFYFRPAKRITMCYNTPKQQKDEKKRLMKLSKRKLRNLDDSEANLLRSVLINNTFRRLKNELGLDQKGRYYGYGINPRSPSGARSRFSIRRSQREEVLRQKYLLDKVPFNAADCDVMDGLASTPAPAAYTDSINSTKTPHSPGGGAHEESMEVVVEECSEASVPRGGQDSQVPVSCDVEMHNADMRSDFPAVITRSDSKQNTGSESLGGFPAAVQSPSCACGKSQETKANLESSEGCNCKEGAGQAVSQESIHQPRTNSDFSLQNQTLSKESERTTDSPSNTETVVEECNELAADPHNQTVSVSGCGYGQDDYISDDGGCDTDSEEIDVVTVPVSAESEANRMQASASLSDDLGRGNLQPPQSLYPLQNGKSIHDPESLSCSPASSQDSDSSVSFKPRTTNSFSVQSAGNLPAQAHFNKPVVAASDAGHFKHFYLASLSHPLKSMNEHHEQAQSDKRDKENSNPSLAPHHLQHSPPHIFNDSRRRHGGVPSALNCNRPASDRAFVFEHSGHFPLNPFHPLTYIFQHQHGFRNFPPCALEQAVAASSSCAVFPLSHFLATSSFASHSFLGRDRPSDFTSVFPPIHQRPLSAEPAC